MKNLSVVISGQGEDVKKETLDKLFEDYKHINPLKEGIKDPNAKPLGCSFQNHSQPPEAS